MAQAQGELYFGVKLNVYDVVAGQNDNVTNIISSINRVGRELGIGGVFHGAVEIVGTGLEWSFGYCEAGTGVYAIEACHNPCYNYRETIDLGPTIRSKEEIKVLLHRLKQEWQGPTYELLSRNCCHFCEAFCKELGVKPVPAWVNRFAAGADATVAFTNEAAALARNIGRGIAATATTSFSWVKDSFSKLILPPGGAEADSSAAGRVGSENGLLSFASGGSFGGHGSSSAAVNGGGVHGNGHLRGHNMQHSASFSGMGVGRGEAHGSHGPGPSRLSNSGGLQKVRVGGSQDGGAHGVPLPMRCASLLSRLGPNGPQGSPQQNGDSLFKDNEGPLARGLRQRQEQQHAQMQQAQQQQQAQAQVQQQEHRVHAPQGHHVHHYPHHHHGHHQPHSQRPHSHGHHQHHHHAAQGHHNPSHAPHTAPEQPQHYHATSFGSTSTSSGVAAGGAGGAAGSCRGNPFGRLISLSIESPTVGPPEEGLMSGGSSSGNVFARKGCMELPSPSVSQDPMVQDQDPFSGLLDGGWEAGHGRLPMVSAGQVLMGNFRGQEPWAAGFGGPADGIGDLLVLDDGRGPSGDPFMWPPQNEQGAGQGAHTGAGAPAQAPPREQGPGGSAAAAAAVAGGPPEPVPRRSKPGTAGAGPMFLGLIPAQQPVLGRVSAEAGLEPGAGAVGARGQAAVHNVGDLLGADI